METEVITDLFGNKPINNPEFLLIHLATLPDCIKLLDKQKDNCICTIDTSHTEFKKFLYDNGLNHELYKLLGHLWFSQDISSKLSKKIKTYSVLLAKYYIEQNSISSN